MEEIVNRLHENRQIELAKSIVESAGYKVNRDDDYLASDEDIEMSLEYLKEKMYSISSMLDNYGGIDLFRQERGGTEELDIPCKMLGGNYDNVYTISEDDEGGRDIMMIHSDMDRKQIKVERLEDGTACILEEVPGMGQFVYQSQWGYEVLFKKF